nr:MAG TPA: putative head-tail adaptor [Caudoviricetes sp.]
MLKFNPTTPVRFYAKETAYVPGQGQSSTWADAGLLYCEWKGAFGDRVTAAQALGVKDSVTVRTFYHPGIYEKLRTVQVVAVKNNDSEALKNGAPDKNNPNVYELWSGIDNVNEENQFMEFRVRRYEGK